MTWEAVHQFVPTLIRGDAIGDHVLWVQRQMRSAGRRSEIFVDVENDQTSALTQPLRHLDRHVIAERTLLVYHVAQASQCAPFLVERPEPLALWFHNFTPVELLAGWDPGAVCALLDAEIQLAQLATTAIAAICDSNYNAQRLADFELPCHVACLPVAPTPAVEPVPHDRPTVLFVGRVAPNKALHDLVAAAAILRHTIPDVAIRLVGGPTAAKYSTALTQLTERLQLTDNVTFTGRVSDAQLEDEYRQADVFCCLSDHEGYGVPLLEAMSRDLPVVAFDSSAVGETVGDAALLLSDKSPTTVATALERVLLQPDLASRLRLAGRQRAAEFDEPRALTELDTALAATWQQWGERP